MALYVSKLVLMQMMAQQRGIPLLQFQQYHTNCLTLASEQFPRASRHVHMNRAELWTWNQFFVPRGCLFPGVDPMYGELVAALEQQANQPTNPSVQHTPIPGQIAAARVEMQKELSQKESELKLKDKIVQQQDELLNVLRQNGTMKDTQIWKKDWEIKQRDQNIEQRDDIIKKYEVLIEKASEIVDSNELLLNETKASIQSRDGFFKERNELITWRNKLVTENDETIANHEKEIRRLNSLLKNKEHNDEAKDEAKNKLKKELTAKTVAHRSRRQSLEREIHDLKTTVFRKNEELVLLPAQVQHLSDINVMSSGSLNRIDRRRAAGINLHLMKEGSRLSSKQLSEDNRSHGVSPKDVLKESEYCNTGEDVDRFLDQMSMERLGSNETGVRVRSEAEGVAFQGSKRNFGENNEENREGAEVKRVKQEREK